MKVVSVQLFFFLFCCCFYVDQGEKGKEWIQQSNEGFNRVQSLSLNSHMPF